MKFWETITGSDITRDWKAFDARAGALPDDLRTAWDEIKAHVLPYSDFTGRNLTPIFDGVLGLLEQGAADGQSAREVLGEDIEGFCVGLVGGEGARNVRDRWREQLNTNVIRKLELGD